MYPKPQFSTLLKRALKLNCPRCGQEKMFSGLFRMNERCSHCDLKYERSPGYFLGSMYINYGVTSVILVVSYVTLHFGSGYSNRALMPWLIGFCVVFPAAFFRHSRALWLAMDSWFDTQDFWD